MDQRKVKSLQKRLHRRAAANCANHTGEDGCLITCHGLCILSIPADRPTANVCSYFMRHVGPADDELFREYLDYFPADYPLKQKRIEGTKKCERCGQPFKPASNRAKYCEGCRDQVRSEQAKKRMRNKRMNDATKSTADVTH